MTIFSLAIASIRSRPLYAGLCSIAIAAGITLLCTLFLLSQGLSSGFTRNAQGIDMIVGTKGSPLQLVLSSVYHADIPAGNITMDDYNSLKQNPRIRQAIPLALGDSYKGFRMVGTTPDYMDLYKARFSEGHVFKAPFETVAGSATGRKLGEEIAVTHGFSADSTDVHDKHLYKITGILEPTGTVLDKLLLTQVESVQGLHAHHHHHEGDIEEEEPDHVEGHHHAHEEHHEHEAEHEEEHDNLESQITSVLLKVRSPIDVMNMPRQINQSSDLMAAVPSYEVSRFSRNLGFGKDFLIMIGAGLIILAALILWSILSYGLALRRYDLAVMRVLGASPFRLSATLIIEAVVISGVGALIGVVFGHMAAYGIVISIEELGLLILPGSLLVPHIMDVCFIMLGIGIGFLASLFPALSAARIDIASLLARGRS